MCQGKSTRADLYALRCVMTLLLALFLALTGLSPAYGQHIDGVDDPEFRTALSLWLEGDDANSIPRFAVLAHEDHPASQILLALIDKTAAWQGPMIALLPRADRVELLRAPGAMSGRNWMSVAAESNQIAQDWVALWQMQGGVDIAERFSALGEARAARTALLMTANRQGTGFAPPVLTAPWYPESLRHLTHSRALSVDDVIGLHAGHPIRKSAGLPVDDDDLRAWLKQSPLSRHFRAACARTCPDTQADCMLALYHGLSSYYALLVMGSPSANIIPEEEFAESARGIQSVARQILVRHTARTREVMLRELGDIDTCAATWLQGEYQRYVPALRSVPTLPD